MATARVAADPRRIHETRAVANAARSTQPHRVEHPHRSVIGAVRQPLSSERLRVHQLVVDTAPVPLFRERPRPGPPEDLVEHGLGGTCRGAFGQAFACDGLDRGGAARVAQPTPGPCERAQESAIDQRVAHGRSAVISDHLERRAIGHGRPPAVDPRNEFVPADRLVVPVREPCANHETTLRAQPPVVVVGGIAHRATSPRLQHPAPQGGRQGAEGHRAPGERPGARRAALMGRQLSEQTRRGGASATLQGLRRRRYQ